MGIIMAYKPTYGSMDGFLRENFNRKTMENPMIFMGK